MKKYIIQFKGHLTSYVFYNDILKELHNYYAAEHTSETLVFDFSLVKTVDPLVIPNLLCIGYIVKETSSSVPELYIPNTFQSINLKRYLYEINFIPLAEKYNLFTFDSSLKGGWNSTGMDKLNTTFLFNVSNPNEKTDKQIKEESRQQVTKAFNKFFNKYLSYYYDFENQKNTLLELSKETIENSILHGESFAFATIQYNYKLKKVFLSFSDCGIGIKNSFLKKLNTNNYISNGLKTKILKMNNEIEAILLGIFYRYGSDFGLYDVIKQVIEKNGVCRIHSNNCQLILTSTNLIALSMCQNEVEFYNFLNTNNDCNYSVRKNLKYDGTHIEIELPLTRRNNTNEF